MTRTLVALVTILGFHSLAAGQCVPEWSVVDSPAHSQVISVWDRDGAGPLRPVLVGAHALPSVPGERDRVQAAWRDGLEWKPIGNPFIGRTGGFASIQTMVTVETSGVGSPKPGLYVGGSFAETTFEPTQNIARWNGERWIMVGGGVGGHGYVAHTLSLCMFDEDGAGPLEASLFVGGYFYEVIGINMPGIVRWDGAAYSKVGDGLVGFRNLPPRVRAMIEFDRDGPGPARPALYVAGAFEQAGGQQVGGIARWDGQAWAALGAGVAQLEHAVINALAVFDADGPGPEPAMLYAGGEFYLRDRSGRRINTLARWDGRNWTAVPGWSTGIVRSLAVFDDDGDGPNKPALFVGAKMFSSLNAVPTNGIAKWDGQRWDDVGSGLVPLNLTGTAMKMQPFDEDDDPSTPAGLYISGYRDDVGITPRQVRWGCPNSMCYADCDQSTGAGVLDVFDFLCFQNAFVTAAPYACDCDTSTGPLVCDMLDFLCFQDAFVAGCP